MKKVKILVVSTKGGVGKSTISMQLVAPYLYEKNGFKAIKYYECDDTNRDINSYGATSLIQRHLVSVNSPMLREEVFDITMQDEVVCIDVGGNNTAKKFIDALDESGGIGFIDLVLIPTLDGEQDMLNALDTYNYLKEIDENLKVVFVLNRLRDREFVKEQFDHFFGDSRGVFNNFLSAEDKISKYELENYIALEDNDVIRYSRRFGLTVYEIAKIEKEYLSDISKSSDPKVASFKHFMSRASKKYYRDVLSEGFEIMDKKLGGIK